MSDLTLLDGPMGTELSARGALTPAPEWSAWALLRRPELVAQVHRDYADAGATVHTANTFRTQRRTLGPRWEAMTRLAVALARQSVPAAHRIAGSLAPLEDCYRPDLSPAAPRPEHREMAQLLADAGCDLLLCETFPSVAEALIAVEEAVATGLPTWAAFTAGPEADLLTPAAMGRAAAEAVSRGAQAVLVNCVPADRSLAFVEQLAGLGVPFGAYANAGHVDAGVGWGAGAEGPARYRASASAWVQAGATLIGGCCGTSPAHVRALATLGGRSADARP